MAKRHHKSNSTQSGSKGADVDETDESQEGHGLPTEGSHLESYLEEHRGKIAFITLLAVVGIAVMAWVIYSRSAKQKAAAVEFTKATTISDYNLVIERHGGTVAGGNAAMMKAKLQWDSGEQTASLKTLNQFIGNFPKHPLNANGNYAIAVREASMGNADVAKKRLKEVVDDHPDSSIAPYAQLFLGDMSLGEGDLEMAKNLYDAAAKMDPGVVNVVERRIQSIKAKTPLVAIEAPPLPKEPNEEVKPPIPPLKPTIPPLRPPVDPVKPPIDPVKPPVDPVKPPVDPVKPPVDPVKPPVDPVKPPVDPVKPPVDPVKPPVDPVKPPVDPVKPPVDPVKPPVDPVKPPVDPVKPPVDPVKPPVDPVEPPVDPVKSPVDPVELPVDPVEPPVDPVKPPVDPVEPPVGSENTERAPAGEGSGDDS